MPFAGKGTKGSRREDFVQFICLLRRLRRSWRWSSRVWTVWSMLLIYISQLIADRCYEMVLLREGLWLDGWQVCMGYGVSEVSCCIYLFMVLMDFSAFFLFFLSGRPLLYRGRRFWNWVWSLAVLVLSSDSDIWGFQICFWGLSLLPSEVWP